MSFANKDLIATAAAALSVLAAGSLWATLPWRMDQVERKVVAVEDIQKDRNERLAAVVATLNSIDARTQRIEAHLDKANK
jgi:hypoxanthine-guanine phosphoribosyltransferase